MYDSYDNSQEGETFENKWAVAWDFQQCGMCDQQASDQPARRRSLIRAFASRLNFLWVLS